MSSFSEKKLSTKVGSLVYATNQGLGILAKSFFDNGLIIHPIIVKHTSTYRHTHVEWYPQGTTIVTWKQLKQRRINKVKSIFSQCDVLLFFETPFDWNLIKWARREGIKTIIMPMYECMPKQIPATPDLWINPSALDQQYFPDGKQVTVPADSEIKWYQRTTAKVFVHNAGNGGLHGRNGTNNLIEAMKYVQSPIKLIIRSQRPLEVGTDHDSRIEVRVGNHSKSELWATTEDGGGDVFVFPDRFNGLSLPLQEAYTAGMCVMATNRFPANTWLPTSPLIPVSSVRKNAISGAYKEFDESIVSPESIAEKIDEYYAQDITTISTLGKMWAQQSSWEIIKPEYVSIIENLCNLNPKTE